jgi:hypothetical protein
MEGLERVGLEGEGEGGTGERGCEGIILCLILI